MSSNIKSTMNLSEWGILLCLSLLWGGSFFFIEVALESMPPLTLVTLRLCIAAAALWLVVKLRALPIRHSWEIWGAFLGIGLLNNVIPFVLIVWAQVEISSALAAILNATMPFFTIIVAHILLRDEKATPLKIIGVIVGFSGVIIMVGPTALEGSGIVLIAQIAVLCAALSYAFAGVYGRRFKKFALDPVVIAAGQTSTSSLFLLPITLVVDQPFSLALPTFEILGSMIALGLFCTALAYVLYFKLLASAGVTNLSLVTFLVPVFAILLGVSFLHEQLQNTHIIGMGLIGCGLIAIDGRLLKVKLG